MLVKTILVTGGTGYIGSHAVIQLLAAGYQVVILDNLANSKASVVQRIQQISAKPVKFVQGDIRDKALLAKIFQQQQIFAVFHFAGLKAVAEAEQEPQLYYDNNVLGSLNLFSTMREYQVNHLIFSSSATVYGMTSAKQYDETMPLQPCNVYGRTKYFIEQILQDICTSDPAFKVAILRYFNPAGAHISGLIGEDPMGLPNNLMPYLAKVASGDLPHLNIYGNDYPTPDGTGKRDYIHVEDLVRGHLLSLDYLVREQNNITVNLGTGRAYSVLELLQAFEKACQRTIPYQFVARRSGDLAEYYANPNLALQQLNWQPQFDVERMCVDMWRWQTFSQANNTKQ